MDAIECGIVKLPRVPVADNVPGGDTPKFRNLWDHIGKKLPKLDFVRFWVQVQTQKMSVVATNSRASSRGFATPPMSSTSSHLRRWDQ